MSDGHKWGPLYRNSVSFFGALLAAVGVVLTVVTLALDFLSGAPSPYIGIFAFLVFPTIIILGIVIFLFGMRRESLIRRRTGDESVHAYPKLDLNDERARKIFGVGLVGGVFLLMLLAVVGYNAFLFSESVSFCGTTCHKVMEPEYTSYLASPHARVRCVDCHVGHGAQWYVKAKISGLKEVWGVITNDYPRPIETPIAALRPARDTCEECHWPAKFFGTQLMQNPHFKYDEKNTAEQISLGVKTGGGRAGTGGNAGIHFHMLMETKISYVATDRQKQIIPYVERVASDGTVEEYLSLDYKGTPEELNSLKAAKKSTIDCMDCHNRPTHHFNPPETAVDRAMASGQIPKDLPWVKKVVVDAITREYPDRPQGHAGMTAEITNFYRDKYPSAYSGRKADVEKAIATAMEIYDRSVFPHMRVNWKTYPMNIGHRNWPGCFRCHDGRHVSSKTKKPITMACDVCHTLPRRGPLAPLGEVSGDPNTPWHPVELAGKHGQIPCSRCHAAGFRPSMDCAGCHGIKNKGRMGTMACSDCHPKPGVRNPTTPCRECHDSLKGTHRKGDHPKTGCTECHKQHTWIPEREVCYACHDDKKEHNAGRLCQSCHDFKTDAKMKVAQAKTVVAAPAKQTR